MKTLLDEILSQETSGNRHTGGCGCASCAQKSAAQSALYPHWKARRQQRLGAEAKHSAQCGCTQCQQKQEAEFEYGDDDFHTYWRRRRQLRHDWPLDVEMETEFEINPTDRSSYQAFANAVAARAELEWSHWWKRGQLKEYHAEAIPLLTDYWVEARPGRSKSYAGTLARDRNKPWSAAFISFVMQRSGAGQHFHYADMHWDYVKAAKLAVGNLNELYWLQRLDRAKPQIGDLVCYSRPTKNFPRVLTFDNAGENKKSTAHCDIVVRVGSTSIDTIGGNKNDTVGKQTLPLTKDGYIDTQSTKGLFGIMSIW